MGVLYLQKDTQWVLIVKGVTKMKTVYQNELIKVNKEIWENDIRNEISDWEDFSTSWNAWNSAFW